MGNNSDLLTCVPFDKQIKRNNPDLLTWIPFDKQIKGNNPYSPGFPLVLLVLVIPEKKLYILQVDFA